MKINRREFLKLMGAAPLALAAGSQVEHLAGNTLASQPQTSLPNILILVFDALSARNMSLYGYPRRTTPQLERMAKSASVYRRHYTGGNFTSPGVASLFTGTYPWAHRAFNTAGTVSSSFIEKNLFSLLARQYHIFTYSHNNYVNLLFDQFRHGIDRLVPKRELCLDSVELAERLLHNNWSTANRAEALLFWRPLLPSAAYFSMRYVQIWQQAMLNRLNQQFQDSFPRGVPNFTTIFFTIEQAVDWLLEQAPALPRPFLGYVHLFPPHFPYNTRREFADLFDDGWMPPGKPFHPFSSNYDEASLGYQRRIYDEFIAYVDAESGRLFDGLVSAGVLEDTLLIFTSDHGELFERGIWEHSTPTLFEPLVHIPLLVWKPGQHQQRNVLTPTSCVDLLPTFLHLAGQPIPDWCEGQILPGFDGLLSSNDRSLFIVEAKENPKFAPLGRASLAMVQGPHKLVRYFGYPEVQNRYELYDLQTDPDELVDLADEKDPQFIALREEMEARFEQRDQTYSKP